ncbi:hypothetical protein [Streptomyces sp. NBC_00878]|uniref:hypothetical protein n=1 Tax=Streptomyces sp. NBC_00878 TaxID=2975854 RepID=UPI00225BB047|nr:hypothetical protein [Streptomyces sp. NBC_00878]MCX4908104.1 hypothetical protein [Streptomyces sp. NBC_00878]
MQSEIVVALITAAGTIGVAYVSFRSGSRDGPLHEPLIDLSVYCGHVWGAAKAATDSCGDGIHRLQRTGRTEEPAGGTYDAYSEMLRQSKDSLDAALKEFRVYRQAAESFGGTLRRLCEAIDASSPSPDDNHLQILGTDLSNLRSILQDLSDQFEYCVNGYVSGLSSSMSARRRRRFRRAARKRYRWGVKSGSALFDPSRRPAAEEPPQGGGAAPDEPETRETPPCGHCIWRCPHAPPGCGTANGDAGPEATSSDPPVGGTAPQGITGSDGAQLGGGSVPPRAIGRQTA